MGSGDTGGGGGGGGSGARPVAAVAARLATAPRAVADADRARVRQRQEEAKAGRKARQAQVLDRLPSRPGGLVRAVGGAACPLPPSELRACMAASATAMAAATPPKPTSHPKTAVVRTLLGRKKGGGSATPPPPANLPAAALHGARAGSLRSALIGLLSAPGQSWSTVAGLERAVAAVAAAVGGAAVFRAPSRETLRLALADVGEYVTPGRWVLFDDLRGEAGRLAAAVAAGAAKDGGGGGGGCGIKGGDDDRAVVQPAAKRARKASPAAQAGVHPKER